MCIHDRLFLNLLISININKPCHRCLCGIEHLHLLYRSFSMLLIFNKNFHSPFRLVYSSNHLSFIHKYFKTISRIDLYYIPISHIHFTLIPVENTTYCTISKTLVLSLEYQGRNILKSPKLSMKKKWNIYVHKNLSFYSTILFHIAYLLVNGIFIRNWFDFIAIALLTSYFVQLASLSSASSINQIMLYCVSIK